MNTIPNPSGRRITRSMSGFSASALGNQNSIVSHGRPSRSLTSLSRIPSLTTRTLDSVRQALETARFAIRTFGLAPLTENQEPIDFSHLAYLQPVELPPLELLYLEGLDNTVSDSMTTNEPVRELVSSEVLCENETPPTPLDNESTLPPIEIPSHKFVEHS